MNRAVSFGLAIACASSLSACAFIKEDINKTLGRGETQTRREAAMAPSQVTTIGVNSYLWRAALDTLSFAPLAQVDSNGGVIVTDWYANPQFAERAGQGDRRRSSTRICAPTRCASPRSRRCYQNGQWLDAPVSAATVQKLEEIILTKARDLRRSAIGG